MRTPVLKNVDVISTLKAILDANTTSFKSDFDYDVKTLKAVAMNPESKTRSFFWMSRHCGTWLFKEYDIFLRDSAAYITWLYYIEQDIGEHPITVNVIIHDYDEVADIVRGDIYLLDYSETCRRIRLFAEPADYADITYEKGTVRSLLSNRVEAALPKYGKFVSYQVVPNDEHSYGIFLWEQDNLRSNPKQNMEVDFHKFSKLLGIPLEESNH